MGVAPYVLKNPKGFYHIMSVNPENVVVAQTDKLFKQIVNKAQIRIVDGIGIVLAGQILNFRVGDRYPGVDLMQDLIKIASERRMTVMFIGGKGNLALRLTECYSRLFPEAKYFGLKGIEDIQNPGYMGLMKERWKEIKKLLCPCINSSTITKHFELMR